MSDSDGSIDTNAGLSATVQGDITIAAVIVILMLFVAALILYLRAKGYSGTVGSLRSQSHHLDFAPNQPNHIKQPLDASILKSLPVTVFRSEDFKDEGGLECAVCISELMDGENARLLPECKHGFHVECIDMWFFSNSTCPLCRNPVGVSNNIKPFVEIPLQTIEVVSETGHPVESQDSSSSSSFQRRGEKGMLAIEIPIREVDGFSSSSNTPLPSSRMPASPALERLRSLRRILSMGSLKSNRVGSSCSPSVPDIEQFDQQ